MTATQVYLRVQAARDRLKSELAELRRTYEGRMSLLAITLNDQLDLIEGILDVPFSYPRASQSDR